MFIFLLEIFLVVNRGIITQVSHGRIIFMKHCEGNATAHTRPRLVENRYYACVEGRSLLFG